MFFFFSCRQERARCRRSVDARTARSRLKANAVGTKKQAGCAGEARRTVYLHITRSHLGAEISRPVGSCYRLQTAENVQAGTVGWVRLVFNCEEYQCRWIRALGWENDDVAIIFAPPFYVSKWRTGRFALEQQVPCHPSLLLFPKNNVLCIKWATFSRGCWFNVAWWPSVYMIRCVVSVVVSAQANFLTASLGS